MEQKVILKYVNTRINIAMSDWRTVYNLDDVPRQLFPETYKGKLVYRARGSSRRISYSQIKKELRKRETIVVINLPFAV